MAEKAVSKREVPPYSNRGVTIGYVPEIVQDGDPVFDAYCATVRANPLEVLDYLEQALMDDGFDPKRQDGPAVRFYGSNVLLVDQQGHRLLSVRYGGRNGFPFVESKGGVSPAVAGILRERFNEHHSPSRMDSAFDRRAPKLFEELHELALQFQRRGIRLDYAGAGVENPDRGTTIYLGSRKSEAFVRIYQKGLKHAEEMGLPPDQIPDWLRYWVRVELELKPDKRTARDRAKALSPKEMWGCSRWTREFAMQAASIDAERVLMREQRETNHERAMRHLTNQYGAYLIEQRKRLGSWEAFGRDIEERMGLLEAVQH